jgi:hypothetical protein
MFCWHYISQVFASFPFLLREIGIVSPDSTRWPSRRDADRIFRAFRPFHALRVPAQDVWRDAAQPFWSASTLLV